LSATAEHKALLLFKVPIEVLFWFLTSFQVKLYSSSLPGSRSLFLKGL
jgi:hypothetical protein